VGPRVVVLGTAQDGGFPHAGCACAHCEGARREASRARRVASIAVVGATGRSLLVDATPDFGEQAARLSALLGRRAPDEILLTHAHVGHYLGLAMLGREAMDARALPVRCTESMERFLRANRPWSHLVDRGQAAPLRVRPEEAWEFDGLRLRAFLSPHRGEDTDTLGLEVRGPSRTLAYVSDADAFPPALAERLRAADVALVDGTFYDAGELPNREARLVPHPLVRDSVRTLAGARGEVWFTHLNHTNPLLSAAPPALPARFGVAADGQEFPL
jgi:pyrroloquinoline quinone biosynthesis protein B